MRADRYMSTRETAEYLGISVRALRRLVYEEGLPAHKIHAHGLRFKQRQVDDWMRSRRVEQTA